MIMRPNLPKALTFPLLKLTGSLLLAASITLAQPVLAGETDAIELDDLEITLEAFDDSADLEAFELRLVTLRESNDPKERDELAERMERFEEEVAAAGEDRAAPEDHAREQRAREAEEAADEQEGRLAREHENERLQEIAQFDSADEMDELDLAAEEEARPEEGDMEAYEEEVVEE